MAPSSRSFQVSARQRDLDAEREAARQQAWYLDPTPAPSSAPTPSGPSPTSGSPTSSPLSPSSSSVRDSGSPRSTQLSQSSRQPVFTSYDPSRTTASAPTPTPSDPLPSNAPAHLHPLHAFLTQSELIQEGSVVFVHTPSSPHAQGVVGDVEASGGAGTGKEESHVGDISGTDPSWEWVVMGVVKGRGKGVVARAERALRVWLKDNAEPQLRTNRPPRRMPRVEAEADWSVIPVSQGICVNLFTAEGRDRWKLDELWLGKQ